MNSIENQEYLLRAAWLQQQIRFQVLPARAGDVERPIVPTSQLSSGATTDFRRPKMESSTAVFDEAMATDAELRAHFAGSEKLKDEFSSVDAYLALVKVDGCRDIEASQVEEIHRLEAKSNAQREALQLQEWMSLTENQLRRLYATSPDLHNEFSCPDAFLAYIRVEEKRQSIPVPLLVAS